MNLRSRRKAMRETKAIHWYFCRDMTEEEIADELGVTEQTVSKYLNSEPSQEAQKMIDWKASQVRVMAVEELQDQLQAAGERSKTAEKPVKIYANENGEVEVKDITDDEGNIVKKVPKTQDIDLLPDEEARYYAREEARDIIDQMCELVGAKEPQEVEVSGSGIVIDMGDDE